MRGFGCNDILVEMKIISIYILVIEYFCLLIGSRDFWRNGLLLILGYKKLKVSWDIFLF